MLNNVFTYLLSDSSHAVEMPNLESVYLDLIN